MIPRAEATINIAINNSRYFTQDLMKVCMVFSTLLRSSIRSTKRKRILITIRQTISRINAVIRF